ncbi:fatty acid desaturase-domain-containing protein [Pyronema domesticum]|nr:fatty acid desaturase-domain-containing protein [Pyronema domesticum]
MHTKAPRQRQKSQHKEATARGSALKFWCERTRAKGRTSSPAVLAPLNEKFSKKRRPKLPHNHTLHSLRELITRRWLSCSLEYPPPAKPAASKVEEFPLLKSLNLLLPPSCTQQSTMETATNAAFARTRRSGSISEISTPVSSLSTSPSLSSSSTSLSSMGDEAELKSSKPLLDTYGNEFHIPNFTIKEIRDCIPRHCWERSAVRSLGYVARDLILIASNFYAFQFHIIPYLSDANGFNYLYRGAAWAVYTLFQGFFGTGIWVLAHECGHQAFSESRTLNSIVGWVLHSSLLVPFFSWQLSHAKHHKSTGNIEKDMAYVPKTRQEYARRKTGSLANDISELTEETPLATVVHLVIIQQLFGWFLYLFANATGHDYHSRQKEGRGRKADGTIRQNGFFDGVNHFNPASPLYEKKDAHLILISDIGICITAFALYLASKQWGAMNVFIWYGIPYLWVNHWIVAITFLQHTDPSLPHYHSEAWNYCRGAAATIDREFGFVGRHLMHGIIETHVLHHFFPLIPFYNADEATEAIKKVMGVHYRSDTKGGPVGFITALWKSSRWCQWVEESEGAEGEAKGVVFFRNRNGLGVPPLAAEKVIPRKAELRNLVQLGRVKKEDVPVDLEE